MALLVCSQKFVVKDLELIRNLSGHFDEFIFFKLVAE